MLDACCCSVPLFAVGVMLFCVIDGRVLFVVAVVVMWCCSLRVVCWLLSFVAIVCWSVSVGVECLVISVVARCLLLVSVVCWCWCVFVVRRCLMLLLLCIVC